jgi:hypothetical protein
VEKAGYRLVGDEPRNDDDPDRLRNIIASCAAYVALVPPRDAADLEFLLRDLQIAQDCGLPVIVVADPKVVEMERQQLLHTPDKACVRFAGALRVLPADMSGGSMDRSLRESLDLVLQMVGGAGARRRNSYSVFYACNPERLSEHERSDIDRVVRGVTGRRCVFADGIDGENADERTLQEIGAAVATIADVSANSLDGWVCAGIARAARRPVALLATEAGLPRPALFSRYKLRRYHSHAERVGLVHAAVYEHRRLFLNQEVLRWT